MELTDLDADERMALVALMKLIVMADGNVSEEEVEQVEAVVQAFGEEAYRSSMNEVDAKFPDEKSLKAFLAKTGRPEARELIYATILDTAISDAVEGHESELLNWLAKEWNVKVEFEGPVGDDAGEA